MVKLSFIELTPTSLKLNCAHDRYLDLEGGDLLDGGDYGDDGDGEHGDDGEHDGGGFGDNFLLACSC